LDQWHKETGFYPEYMTGKLKQYFNIAKTVSAFFDTTQPILNILLYRIHLALADKNKFPEYAQRFRAAYFNMAERFFCMRNNKVAFLGVMDKKHVQPVKVTIVKIMQEIGIEAAAVVPAAKRIYRRN
ncbi:MAG TPA: hypothetical protein VHZ76_06605, partial [Gammaproteobacteria bacterium]|nr:hypothetical protein [Gammaproteobacteria bacterium]